MEVQEFKFVPVEGGTILESIHGKCPKCNFDFAGEDVKMHFLKHLSEQPNAVEDIEAEAERIAAMYGWTAEKPVSFSNIMGIEIRGAYDGTVMHQCPECHTTWDRFTNREGTYEMGSSEIPEESTEDVQE